MNWTDICDKLTKTIYQQETNIFDWMISFLTLEVYCSLKLIVNGNIGKQVVPKENETRWEYLGIPEY